MVLKNIKNKYLKQNNIRTIYYRSQIFKPFNCILPQCILVKLSPWPVWRSIYVEYLCWQPIWPALCCHFLKIFPQKLSK